MRHHHLLIACCLLSACEKESTPPGSSSTPPLTGANEGPNYAGPDVKDLEGHTYPTVFMGNGQHWMSANLRSTVLCNGTPLATGLTPDQWGSNTAPAYAIYNDEAAYADTFGLLYNGYAADDGHCLCPEGWHVPTAQEWNTLTLYLDPGANPANWEPMSTQAGGPLKAVSSLWLPPNAGATNWSLFSGLPAGQRRFNGEYANKGLLGAWWSTSLSFSSTANTMEVRYEYPWVWRPPFASKHEGYAVRCIRNTELYRPGPGVTDHEGHTYPTVILYNGQEWMASNLRTSTFRNGEQIPSSIWSWTFPEACSASFQDNGSNDDMGRLYNWWATGDARGICPMGWHVPTQQEWLYMERAMGGRASDEDLNGWADRGAAENVGGKLKRTTLWQGSNTGANNSSGMGLEPGGWRRFIAGQPPGYSYSYERRGTEGYWWTSSEISDSYGWYRSASTWSAGFLQSTMSKKMGLCVRCMKDQ